jgi:outer membrane protein
MRAILTGLVLLAVNSACQAQVKLATINMNSVLAGTQDGHKAILDLNTKRAGKSREFEQKQNDILALQDQLSKGANTLSEAAKNALFASISARKKIVQREMEDAQIDLEADEQKILQELGSKILAVVQRYAHDNGYTMVVDVGAVASPVLYASADTDITRDVIDLYDKSGSSKSTPLAK